MKVLKSRLFQVVASAVTLLAMVSVSSASFILTHQPKEPKCLKK